MTPTDLEVLKQAVAIMATQRETASFRSVPAGDFILGGFDHSLAAAMHNLRYVIIIIEMYPSKGASDHDRS